MIVISASGANLPDDLAKRLGISLVPQSIQIDSQTVDIVDLTLDDLERAFHTAKTFPYPLAAPASAYINQLLAGSARADDFLIVTASRHLNGSYDAANAAMRTVQAAPAFAKKNIRLLDSRLVDLGVGMVTLRCAAAAKGGASPAEVVDMAHAMSGAAVQSFLPATLDAIRKSGRAAFLKSFAADFFNIFPVLSVLDGYVKNTATMKRGGDPVSFLATHVVERAGAGKTVWLSIMHGNVPLAAKDLEDRLRTSFDVRFCINRPLSPAMYCVSGLGCIGATVMPVEGRFVEPPT